MVRLASAQGIERCCAKSCAPWSNFRSANITLPVLTVEEWRRSNTGAKGYLVGDLDGRSWTEGEGGTHSKL